MLNCNAADAWSETQRVAEHIHANKKTFPSGMKVLGDYVHSKGLAYILSLTQCW